MPGLDQYLLWVVKLSNTLEHVKETFDIEKLRKFSKVKNGKGVLVQLKEERESARLDK